MSELNTARAAIEQAAQGLLYLSENEAPFTFVSLGAPPAELGPRSFATLAGSAGAAEEVALDRFFAGHIENADPGDPVMQGLVPRYRALKAALQEHLAGVRVFRLGKVEIACYAVGITTDGQLAGVSTMAYET
jgi:hypothetical protein